MPLPNFLCVGAQKSGTSTLYSIFKQHPNILVPEYKEVHFFDNPQNYRKGKEWYAQKFAHHQNEKLIGEVSPDCMHLKDSPKWMKEVLGEDIKLIFILRNPVDRAFSHYLMTYRLGYEKKKFLEAIELEKERIHQDIESRHRFSYITRGMYYDHIQHYLKYFPREQMKFMIFEKVFLQKEKQRLDDLFQFLGVDSIEVDLGMKKNKGSVPVAKWLTPFISKKYKDRYPLLRWIRTTLVPTQRLRNYLLRYLKRERPQLEKDTKYKLYQRFYKEQTEKVEEFLGEDLEIWRKKYL